jgi:serine/threonine-protein kinase
VGTLKPDETIGHFLLLEKLGSGGLGEVWRARDQTLNRAVALKFVTSGGRELLKEARAASALNHPNIVTVFEVGDSPHGTYMAMEQVDGETLRAKMTRAALTPTEIADIAAQIAEGLGVAHAAGIVHRDLKPENIMIDSQDRIKLIDFGIAGKEGSRRLTFAKLTDTMGTPEYISPEQVKGKRGDGRSDIYALGVMLYEMLTGKTPFAGANPFLIMNDRLLNNPIPPREINPEISPEMQEIVYRAIERDPKNRYSHAHEMAWDLRNQDQVGVSADRAELTNWKKRRTPWLGRILFYIGMAAIPLVIFGLLLWVAKHT